MSDQLKEITTSDALAEISKTINLIGIKKTIEALKNARLESPSPDYSDLTDKENMDFLCKVICDVTGVNKNHITNKSKKKLRTDEGKIALCLFCFYCRNTYELNPNTIALYIGRSRTWEYQSYKIIADANKVNPKNPFDKMLKQFYDKVNITINNNN